MLITITSVTEDVVGTPIRPTFYLGRLVTFQSRFEPFKASVTVSKSSFKCGSITDIHSNKKLNIIQQSS